MLIWGDVSVSWQSFQTVGWNMTYLPGCDCCQRLQVKFESEFLSIRNSLTSQVISIQKLRLEPNVDPMDSLWRFRRREATDPRDKVFGLLGLLRNWSLGDKAKDYYSMDVVQLYHLVTVALIRHDHSLRCMIGRRGESSNNPNVASWAAEWLLPPSPNPDMASSAPRGRYWSHKERWRFFNADKGLKAVLREGPGAGIISLHGLYVDRAIAVGEPLISSDEKVDPTLQRRRIKEWRELAREHAPPRGTYIAGRTWEDAFWRSMVGNMIIHGSSDQDSYFPFPRRARPEDEQEYKCYENSA
jgi:hypothetical protein